MDERVSTQHFSLMKKQSKLKDLKGNQKIQLTKKELKDLKGGFIVIDDLVSF